MGKHIHILISKDVENRTGVCANCGPVGIRIKAGYWKCQKAVNEHRGDRRHGRSSTHNFTEIQAAAMRKGKECELCGATERLTVDHCHASHVFRGILCNSCNLGLGHFRDNPQLLAAAIQYLEKSKTG